jgi:hypothetical protein
VSSSRVPESPSSRAPELASRRRDGLSVALRFDRGVRNGETELRRPGDPETGRLGGAEELLGVSAGTCQQAAAS